MRKQLHFSARLNRLLAATLLGCVGPSRSLSAQVEQRVADLGTCRLSQSQMLSPCVVGYRVFGRLSPAKDNVVLVPTWLGGRSADWLPLLGPQGILDTTSQFVVVIDALGNGVSSSPSTATGRAARSFPAISIGDMVETQYRLATDALHLTHVRAIVGVSMGGMQTFEWAAVHPDFADRFVSIVGTPRVMSYDEIWLRTMLRQIEEGRRAQMPDSTIYVLLAGVFQILATTPGDVNATLSRPVDPSTHEMAGALAQWFRLDDFAAQVRAILAYDFASRTQVNAARLGGRLLVVVNPVDHVVSAGTPLRVAGEQGAEAVQIDSPCGHLVFRCEAKQIGERVARFLRR